MEIENPDEHARELGMEFYQYWGDSEENWISSKYAESHIHPMKEIVKELLKGLETQNENK